MDPVFKDALIRLARVAITAGIVAAVGAFLKIGTAADPVTIVHVVVGAFATGVIAALMEYLRTTLSTPITPVGKMALAKSKVAGAFQYRTKNIFDYFPI